MLNRLTVSALLKTVISATSLVVVVGFSLTAWNSWNRLQLTNRVGVIADASANIFKAMDRLRSDRSTSVRSLNTDQPISAAIEEYLRDLRDAEMPAMGHALEILPSVEFAQKPTLLPEVDRLFKTLEAKQKELGRDCKAQGFASSGTRQGVWRHRDSAA
jgi:hypothetical protein